MRRLPQCVMCLVIVGALVTSATAAQVPTDPSRRVARIEGFLDRLTAFGFSGVVLVAKGDQPVLEKGYGLADREHHRSFERDTVVSLGSITKQFTGAAVLKLEMQGKLHVTDPITKFFSDVPPDKTGITLHHLLTHTAGIESDFGRGDFEPVTRDEIIRRALKSKLRSAPGEKYHYSNAGYSLLGAVIEIASGQSYETYLKENLFDPAGMTNTGYRLSNWAPEKIAQGYEDGQRFGTILDRLPADGKPSWNLLGNGGVHTTMDDMLRWHLALLNDSVLPKEQRDKLFTPHVREGAMPTHYGYGWSIRKTPRGTRVIEHNGGNGVFEADCERFVDDGFLVFTATNDSEISATRINSWITKLLFDGTCPDVPQTTKVDAGELARCAGTYALPAGGKLIAKVSGDKLIISAEGQSALALLATGAASSERLNAASQRTAALVDACLKGDYAPLQKAFGNRAPLEVVRQNQTRLRERLEAEHGAFQRYEVLGSMPTGRSAETYVRMDYAKGSVVFGYGWAGSQLMVVRQASSLPGAVSFAPVSGNEYASFHFGTGRVRKVRFESDAQNHVIHLVVQGKEGDVVAKKI